MFHNSNNEHGKKGGAQERKGEGGVMLKKCCWSVEGLEHAGILA
jgi:hypothetical protein